MSASKLRAAAAGDNLDDFMKGVPKQFDKKAAEKLFNTLQKRMKVEKVKKTETEYTPAKKASQKSRVPQDFGYRRDAKDWKEESNLWQIAPKFDLKNLRENFIKGKLFQVDDIVENDNTGLVGKIIRKGTNYIIAVTENNIMFKSWIQNISEWTDRSGVPSDQRLVGTDSYREYVQSLTSNATVSYTHLTLPTILLV